MWSQLHSIDPGRGLRECLFTFQDSGAQTLVSGTNVTATHTATGVVTVTFADIHIYNDEVPVIIPTIYQVTGAVMSPHIGTVTITAASGTLAVVVRFYNASGAADLVDNVDKLGLLVDYRRSAA